MISTAKIMKKYEKAKIMTTKYCFQIDFYYVSDRSLRLFL